MLKGTLRRGTSPDDLRFSVSDGVQVAARRRNSRLRVNLPVTLRTREGSELRSRTADVSATGVGVYATDVAGPGEPVRADLVLPSGDVVVGTGRVVRCTQGVTAVRFHAFAGDGRRQLAEFVLERQRARAVAAG